MTLIRVWLALLILKASRKVSFWMLPEAKGVCDEADQ